MNCNIRVFGHAKKGRQSAATRRGGLQCPPEPEAESIPPALHLFTIIQPSV